MNTSLSNAKLEANDSMWRYSYAGAYALPGGEPPLFANFDIGNENFVIIVGRDDGNYDKPVANACLERYIDMEQDESACGDTCVYTTPDVTVDEAITIGNQMLQYFKDKYESDDSTFDEADFMKNFTVDRQYV